MGHRADSETGRKSYNHPCLIAQTLDVLGDRWTLLILRDLMSGLHRYTDILDNCTGMSPNVLSDRLKRLEGDGLVNRLYFRELPPRVEYSLTEKGWSVRPVLLSLLQFGRENFLSSETGDESEPHRQPASIDFSVRVVPAFAFRPGTRKRTYRKPGGRDFGLRRLQHLDVRNPRRAHSPASSQYRPCRCPSQDRHRRFFSVHSRRGACRGLRPGRWALRDSGRHPIVFHLHGER